jgi:beta-lactamase class A
VEDGIGVAIDYTTPRGTLSVSLHGAERYPAASVMKLAILAAVEDGIAQGDLQRNADVDDLEEQMIVYSDNDAANELIDFVGRAQINAVMQRLGMTQSYIGSHFDVAYGDDDDDNYLTPRESLLLMDALVSGAVGGSTRIRDLLGRSEAPGSVRDALPTTGAPLYEKRGWYDGVENDVVRLDLGHGATVTIAIFEPDVSDIDAAWVLFADLANLAVDVSSSP